MTFRLPLSVLALSVSLPLTASLALLADGAFADSAPSAAGADETSPRALWHRHIATLYDRLADASERLRDQADTLCSADRTSKSFSNRSSDNAPDSAAEEQLRARWLDAYRAWQAVRFVDFGPIELDSRAWQLQFWPDDKNLVGTRMAARLRQDTPITAETIATAGVAEKGFPALEYLLSDEAMAAGSLEKPVGCSLTQAIVAHLVNITTQLSEDWQDFGPHYLSTDSYSDATVHGAMQLLDTLEDKRLGRPLGMMGSPANAYRAEAWRSDASVSLVEASLAGLEEGFMPGLRALFAAEGKTDGASAELIDAFATQLDHTLDQARAIDGGIASGLENTASQQQLGSLYLNVAQLRELLNRQIAAELDIVRGFNSSDGD